jgi:succinate dehydrogenase / fumarate reductase cytochrome b subunit
MKSRRPAFFDVTQIQMPVGAVTSIGHRVSGVLLALGIPYLLYLLHLSLEGPEGYASATSTFHAPGFKVLGVVFAWALAHHLLAGIRHLLSDIDVGTTLHAARLTGWVANGGALAIAALSAGALW